MLCYKFHAREGTQVTPVLRITAPRGIDRVVMLHLDISATSSIRGLAGGRAHRRLPCKSTQSVGRGSYLALWYWIAEWQTLHPCFYICLRFLLVLQCCVMGNIYVPSKMMKML